MINKTPVTNEDLKKLEKNVKEDIRSLGEIVSTKEDIKNFATKEDLGKFVFNIKDHIDNKIGDLRAETVVKHKRIVDAFQHLALIVERNHNLDKADKKDIVIVKDLLNSV